MFLRNFGVNDFLFLLEALQWTLVLTALALLGGGLVGFAVALARTARARPLRIAATIYIQLVQGIPVLMILFLSYYGLSMAGYRLPPLIAASLSMTIYVSGYLGEIWRGCIQAVPKPQWESGESLALSLPQQYLFIILPQAVRLSLAPTVGFSVQVVKNTSVCALIGFVELTRAGQLINNATFQPFKVFLTVAALYFMICYPMSQLSRWLERRLHAGSRH